MVHVEEIQDEYNNDISFSPSKKLQPFYKIRSIHSLAHYAPSHSKDIKNRDQSNQPISLKKFQRETGYFDF